MIKKNLLFSDYLGLYDKIYYPQKSKYKKEAKQVARFFPKNIKKILDVGSGTGMHALELWGFGYDVDCIDVSGEAVDKTKGNLAMFNASVKKADISKLKTKSLSATYDAVISLFIVFSYLNRKDFVKALKNIYALLKKDGVCVFDVVSGEQTIKNFKEVMKFNGGGYEVEWRRKIDKKSKRLKTKMIATEGKEKTIDYQDFYYYLPEELKSILSKIGFKNISFLPDYSGKNKTNRKRICVICRK